MKGNIWKTNPHKSGHIRHGKGIETWKPPVKRKPCTPPKPWSFPINFKIVLHSSKNDYEKTLGTELKLKI
jgi:hypothetical protein